MRQGFWIVALALALLLALLPARHTAWAATVTVNSTTDVSDGDTSSIANLIANPGADGVISLREAIEAANNTPGSDTINFNISGCGGVCTIQPTNALPTLTGGGTTIDGYSQPGAAEATDGTPATLLIEINGASAGNTSGFYITSAENVIRGLVINRFLVCGVYIYGSSVTGNTVSGNYIGTDANGTADLGNGWYGVYIGGSAQNNTVGGNTAGARNIISGNDQNGVYIYGSGTTGNTISGNYIGTDASGTADLGNYLGVSIGGGAQNNTIGGDTASERNVISGNLGGVSIYSSNNIVSGNYIGTDASGTADLGNTYHGVSIGGGAQNNTVGGDIAGERNVISGNDLSGVYIADSGTMSNTVSGNYIGTDANGTAALGNNWDGVQIEESAQNNTVGGNTAGERNIISGNYRNGVCIAQSGTTGNTVSGNYIGTDTSGAVGLSSAQTGVLIVAGAQNNTVGGDTAGERNVISGNLIGVSIYYTNTMSNTISGNYIGTDASGTADVGNIGSGVSIGGGARNNTVGPGNVIAHNSRDGVAVDGSSTTGNTITQNSIFANNMGIELTNGANGGIAAPVIVATISGSVNIVGTACAGCTVEVFENGDTDGEGETYVGDTTANASGTFTVTVSSLSAPYLTATATDAVSGTSEFSAVFTATTVIRPLYLPIILKSY